MGRLEVGNTNWDSPTFHYGLGKLILSEAVWWRISTSSVIEIELNKTATADKVLRKVKLED